MASSIDFRQKVLENKEREDLSFKEVAVRFGIGQASVFRWSKRLFPCRNRDKPAVKIDMAALSRDVEERGSETSFCLNCRTARSSSWTTMPPFTNLMPFRMVITLCGHELEFLPPSSPDLNQIEYTWAQAKALRKKYRCSVEELFQQNNL